MCMNMMIVKNQFLSVEAALRIGPRKWVDLFIYNLIVKYQLNLVIIDERKQHIMT